MDFYEILRNKKILAPRELESMKKRADSTGRSIEEILLEKKIIGEEEIVKIKGEVLKVPFKDLTDVKIPPEVLREVPEEAAARYQFIAFDRKGDVLEVGMVNPEDAKALEALKFITLRKGFGCKIYIIGLSNFYESLKQYRSLKKEVKEALEELKKELHLEAKVAKPKKREEIERIIAEAPITKVVAVILKHAIEGRASDIHIEPTEEKLKVRFRVDGVLYTSIILSKSIHPAVISRIKILSNLKIDESRVPQDGRFHTDIDDKPVDLRVSTLPTAWGEKAAIRILDPSIGTMTLPEVGLRGRSLEVINNALEKPYGMVLITGPTGSGKSTTLYAMLRLLNQEGVNIVSLEDPVEYYIEGVNQSQIRPEIKYTFASGLRHVLRQDPDIIMVGEIRDKETASLAIHAALTGHLLFSTLHTNNAIGVVPRLIDMGIEPFLISSSLAVVVAQRLVKRLCPKCRKAVSPSPKVKAMLEKELAEIPEEEKKGLRISPLKIYEPQGCKYCSNKGTKGRIAIFETLSMTPELTTLITEKPSESEILKEARRQKMITLKQDGILKALEGIVSLEEVAKTVEE